MPRTTKPEPTVVDVLTQGIPAPATAPAAVRPVPERELTPEQRRIRDLEDQLAQERGRKDPEEELDQVEAGADGNILIHFLEDGFTALGKVWYRGQELEFTPGSGAYNDTRDRNGRTWLDLAGNDMAQIRRYGKVMFRTGPWPGLKLTESPVEFEGLKGAARPTGDELSAAERAELGRGRAAPRLPVR